MNNFPSDSYSINIILSIALFLAFMLIYISIPKISNFETTLSLLNLAKWKDKKWEDKEVTLVLSKMNISLTTISVLAGFSLTAITILIDKVNSFTENFLILLLAISTILFLATIEIYDTALNPYWKTPIIRKFYKIGGFLHFFGELIIYFVLIILLGQFYNGIFSFILVIFFILIHSIAHIHKRENY